MSIQHDTNTRTGLIPALLLCTLALSVWSAASFDIDLIESVKASGSTAAQCQTQADIQAAQDRSRNGISLSCTSQILAARISR